MRVIDHKHHKAVLQKKHAKKQRKAYAVRLVFSMLIVAGVITGGALAVKNIKLPTRSNNDDVKQAKNEIIETPKKGVLKQFTPQQFRDLYNSFAYPNTERISAETPITGDYEADMRIRKIAEERGYTLRSAPVANVFVDVGDGYRLQERAAQPWIDLRDTAKKDNIIFNLMDAYRSADEQLEIFLPRLTAAGVPLSGIASGRYDSQIIQVLSMTAVPGYSRHHTGYTIDLECGNTPGLAFENTVCFDWLNKNNYENAKKFGWIPSYPEGTGQQGPEPEAWEYVWVGIDAVTE